MKWSRGIVACAAIAFATESAAATIVLARKDGPDFAVVREGIAAEVRGAHKLVDYFMTDATTYAEFAKAMREKQPDLVVLMDNIAVSHMIRFGREPDAFAKGLKAIATMSLNLKRVLEGQKQIAGIAYEVSAFAVISEFRYLVRVPVHRVAVFYRKSQYDIVIREAKDQLGRAGIELLPVDVEVEGKNAADVARFLEAELKENIQGSRVDAILVLSDNGLINEKTFGPVWLKSAKSFGVPLITNLSAFVSKDLDFCAFAVSPNLRDLGSQTAEMILSVVNDGESPGTIGVNYVLSAGSVADFDKLDRLGIKVDEQRAANVRRAE